MTKIDKNTSAVLKSKVEVGSSLKNKNEEVFGEQTIFYNLNDKTEVIVTTQQASVNILQPLRNMSST